MKIMTPFCLLSLIGPLLLAQQAPQLLVGPYLQDAEPNSITIMWETDHGEEGLVEYGTTPKLGKRAQGRAEDINFSASRVHTVKLQGLDRFTTYYYRVSSGRTRSDIHQFKTPPFSHDGESFQLAAMSDMQYDGQHPNKFSEMVNQGLLEYLKKEYGGEVPDNLAMVLIAGDLVENGSKYHQWKDHFFDPAQNLFAQVPLYPVLGNHERNSVFYFKYFSLPSNGTPAYAEHWWYKDYGNTRVIGLNSNEGYRDLREQYQWLGELLAETERDGNIDFVFAQLHHPHKSELWLPGEEESTGKVVEMLEDFSTRSGKPSVHFFGHTHAYSRGQSRDHKHLWINVASAGGSLDNWGEFEGRDYEEFTVSQDEYGFVMVEVDGNRADPKFTIKRIGRGNQDQVRDNEIRDSITVWRVERRPETPKALAPDGVQIDTAFAMLRAGDFSSSLPGAFHGASHWQLSQDRGFEKLELDQWKQFENQYNGQDIQRDDDLRDEKTRRLKPGTTYHWRVRYRDQHLNWSHWSQTATFTTK